MKINEVIERHGMQLRDVSREMGMKPSALQSAIDRNLTVKTLRLIANAAKIPIAEFFMDELTDPDRQQLLATLQPSAQPSQQPVVEPAPKTEASQADNLPFNNEPEQQAEKRDAVAAIICPHCGEAIKLAVV